jgi:hypothetical protein
VLIHPEPCQSTGEDCQVCSLCIKWRGKNERFSASCDQCPGRRGE